ncbi:MAG: recombination protein RecR [Phycisphaerales bacterium]|nr:recombination protein RecR [Phycisphaerales bacterium]
MPDSPSDRAYPEPVRRLIAELEKLPGIGKRSAERMAFHVLKSNADDAKKLSQAVVDVKERVRYCSVCYTLTDTELCPICRDDRRDAGLILIVEQPRDLISLEQTGLYKGVYHVLLGRLDPLHGVEPDDLTIADLLQRIDDPSRNARGVAVREVILGLNPDMEGDSTGLFLVEAMKARKIAVTRLARGIPAGSQLEYASRAVLADAIEGRQHLH